MNWCDYVVIGIIALFAIIGLVKGLVMSCFKVASFFACIFASIRLYPVFSDILRKSPVHAAIYNSVMKSLMLKGQEALATSSSPVSGGAAYDVMLGSVSLPAFLKESVARKLPSAAEIINVDVILKAMADEITLMVISVLSLIILYVVMRIVLACIGLVLRSVSKLPVIKQVDKAGGLLFGLVQGILAVFVVCALLVLVNSNPAFEPVFNGIGSSMFAWRFYENNFIFSLMFPT